MIVIKSEQNIYIGYSIHEFGYSHLTNETLKLDGNLFLFNSFKNNDIKIICNEVGLFRDILRFDIDYPDELSTYSIQTNVIPQIQSCVKELDEYKELKTKTFKTNFLIIKDKKIFFITNKGFVEEIYDHYYIGDYQLGANMILNMYKDAHPETRIIYVYDYLVSVYNTKLNEIIFEKLYLQFLNE